MKWLLLAGAGLALLILAVTIVGALLPREHTASRSLRLRHAPPEVWAVVTGALDASPMPVDVLENRPPTRLVTRVKESERNFGGTWTIEIVPGPGGGDAGTRGSTLTITENGWVANPIFRFVSRVVIGHYATIDRLLTGVARTLHEDDARISGR
jgi:hypothetical protein